MSVIRVVGVEPREGYRVWLRYEDGAEGVVDLSDLACRGVFEAWRDRPLFESVRVNERGALEWPGDIDLCGDALYFRLTGKSAEEVFPRLRAARADA